MEDELLGDILGEIKSSASSVGRPKLPESKRFLSNYLCIVNLTNNSIVLFKGWELFLPL
jgi:hypothetical protein